MPRYMNKDVNYLSLTNLATIKTWFSNYHTFANIKTSFSKYQTLANGIKTCFSDYAV